jgi:hypothetical protein
MSFYNILREVRNMKSISKTCFMNFKDKLFLKIQSIILLITFLVTSMNGFVYANHPMNLNIPKITNSQLNDLANYLPSNIGKITSTYKGISPYKIILIQDLHCDSNAQEKIYKIIGRIQSVYKDNCKVAGIEGSFGNVDNSILTSIPNEIAKEKILKYFMDLGYISGADKYQILNPKTNLKLQGIENKEMYLENFEKLYISIEYREKINGIINETNKWFENAKKYLYTDKLNLIENAEKLYSRSRLDTTTYYKFLSVLAREQHIKVSEEYKNMSMILEAIDIKVNLGLVKTQANNLIKIISKNIKNKEIAGLLKDNNYELLEKFSKNFGITLNEGYEELNKYFKYLELTNNINEQQLLEEEKGLTYRIKDNLKISNDARSLLYCDKYLKLFSKYLNNSVSSREIELWNANKDKFFTEIEKLEHKISLKDYFKMNEDLITNAEKNMEEFYNLADKRNEVMVGNVIPHLMPDPASKWNKIPLNPPLNKGGNQQVIILLVGGYHREGIENVLKNKGVSYEIVMPTVDFETNNSNYLRRINEQAKFLKETNLKSNSTVNNNCLALMHYSQGGDINYGIVQQSAKYLLDISNNSELVRNWINSLSQNYRKIHIDNNGEIKGNFGPAETFATITPAKLKGGADNAVDFTGVSLSSWITLLKELKKYNNKYNRGLKNPLSADIGELFSKLGIHFIDDDTNVVINDKVFVNINLESLVNILSKIKDELKSIPGDSDTTRCLEYIKQINLNIKSKIHENNRRADSVLSQSSSQSSHSSSSSSSSSVASTNQTLQQKSFSSSSTSHSISFTEFMHMFPSLSRKINSYVFLDPNHEISYLLRFLLDLLSEHIPDGIINFNEIYTIIQAIDDPNSYWGFKKELENNKNEITNSLFTAIDSMILSVLKDSSKELHLNISILKQFLLFEIEKTIKHQRNKIGDDKFPYSLNRYLDIFTSYDTNYKYFLNEHVTVSDLKKILQYVNSLDTFTEGSRISIMTLVDNLITTALNNLPKKNKNKKEKELKSKLTEFQGSSKKQSKLSEKRKKEKEKYSSMSIIGGLNTDQWIMFGKNLVEFYNTYITVIQGAEQNNFTFLFINVFGFPNSVQTMQSTCLEQTSVNISNLTFDRLRENLQHFIDLHYYLSGNSQEESTATKGIKRLLIDTLKGIIKSIQDKYEIKFLPVPSIGINQGIFTIYNNNSSSSSSSSLMTVHRIPKSPVANASPSSSSTSTLSPSTSISSDEEDWVKKEWRISDNKQQSKWKTFKMNFEKKYGMNLPDTIQGLSSLDSSILTQILTTIQIINYEQLGLNQSSRDSLIQLLNYFIENPKRISTNSTATVPTNLASSSQGLSQSSSSSSSSSSSFTQQQVVIPSSVISDSTKVSSSSQQDSKFGERSSSSSSSTSTSDNVKQKNMLKEIVDCLKIISLITPILPITKEILVFLSTDDEDVKKFITDPDNGFSLEFIHQSIAKYLKGINKNGIIDIINHIKLSSGLKKLYNGSLNLDIAIISKLKCYLDKVYNTTFKQSSSMNVSSYHITYSQIFNERYHVGDNYDTSFLISLLLPEIVQCLFWYSLNELWSFVDAKYNDTWVVPVLDINNKSYWDEFRQKLGKNFPIIQPYLPEQIKDIVNMDLASLIHILSMFFHIQHEDYKKNVTNNNLGNMEMFSHPFIGMVEKLIKNKFEKMPMLTTIVTNYIGIKINQWVYFLIQLNVLLTPDSNSKSFFNFLSTNLEQSQGLTNQDKVKNLYSILNRIITLLENNSTRDEYKDYIPYQINLVKIILLRLRPYTNTTVVSSSSSSSSLNTPNNLGTSTTSTSSSSSNSTQLTPQACVDVILSNDSIINKREAMKVLENEINEMNTEQKTKIFKEIRFSESIRLLMSQDVRPDENDPVLINFLIFLFLNYKTIDQQDSNQFAARASAMIVNAYIQKNPNDLILRTLNDDNIENIYNELGITNHISKLVGRINTAFISRVNRQQNNVVKKDTVESDAVQSFNVPVIKDPITSKETLNQEEFKKLFITKYNQSQGVSKDRVIIFIKSINNKYSIFIPQMARIIHQSLNELKINLNDFYDSIFKNVDFDEENIDLGWATEFGTLYQELSNSINDLITDINHGRWNEPYTSSASVLSRPTTDMTNSSNATMSDVLLGKIIFRIIKQGIDEQLIISAIKKIVISESYTRLSTNPKILINMVFELTKEFDVNYIINVMKKQKDILNQVLPNNFENILFAS